jgi:hypothetical protein
MIVLVNYIPAALVNLILVFFVLGVLVLMKLKCLIEMIKIHKYVRFTMFLVKFILLIWQMKEDGFVLVEQMDS